MLHRKKDSSLCLRIQVILSFPKLANWLINQLESLKAESWFGPSLAARAPKTKQTKWHKFKLMKSWDEKLGLHSIAIKRRATSQTVHRVIVAEPTNQPCGGFSLSGHGREDRCSPDSCFRNPPANARSTFNGEWRRGKQEAVLLRWVSRKAELTNFW